MSKVGQVDIDRILLEISQIKIEDQLSLHTANGIGGNGQIELLQYNEHEYIHPEYKDIMPYTYSILEQYNMYRARVMVLPAKTCYSFHYDHSKRIHIPLITNEKCFLLIENQSYHLPADGSVYLINTTLYHTALNGTRGTFDRIHIVGNIDADPPSPA